MPLIKYFSNSHTNGLDMNIGNLRRFGGNLMHIFIICLAIFVSIQLTLFLFQLTLYPNLLCKSTFFNREIRVHIFKCLDDTHLYRPRILQHLVAYFDNPYERYDARDDNQDRNGRHGLIVRVQPETADSPWHQAEAIAAMNAARRYRTSGNFEKARTVVKHAFSLAPHNPDILTEYGILLETADNIVGAEGYYLRALNHDPKHSEALQRRARALPLVEEIDNLMLKEIFRKRDIFLKIPHYDSGLKRAMRESYFQHIYHTVALEGNTMTLVQTRSLLETKVAVGGKSIIEHNEILGMDAAMRYLNQTLSHVGSLTLEHILQIHKRVLGYVDPMMAGEIRTTQVYVGSFTPTSPQDIMPEMEELVAWLNDEDTLSLDAVEMAALAHYKLVFIHPFIDGNGRTSRLLMNFILMQAGFPPVIIHVENRLQYYSALQSANKGDLRPFIRFIAEQMDRTLASFIASSLTMCDAEDCRQFMKVEDASPSTIAGLP